jgi:DNA-binding LacI/PurR family transcriptional regulator
MSPKPGKVTIRDVASAAGVSVSTVSQALNGRGRVDASTRERVERIATKLGYHANRNARALRSGRTGTIGLVLPQVVAAPLAIDYYVGVAMAAAQAAFMRDYALLLLPPLRSHADVRRFAIDGAILADPPAGEMQLSLLEQSGLPVVTIDRDLKRSDWRWWVAADNAASTRRMLDHLEQAGARRVALLSTTGTLSWLDECTRAYRAWMRERGRKPLVAKANLRAIDQSGTVAAGRLLDSDDPPDAFFVLVDRFVANVLDALAERDLDVPGDVMVAAGEDGAQLRTGRVPVTTIDLRPVDGGRAVVEMLLGRIEGGHVEAPRIVPVDLCVRASTIRAAVAAPS